MESRGYGVSPSMRTSSLIDVLAKVEISQRWALDESGHMVAIICGDRFAGCCLRYLRFACRLLCLRRPNNLSFLLPPNHGDSCANTDFQL